MAGEPHGGQWARSPVANPRRGWSGREARPDPLRERSSPEFATRRFSELQTLADWANSLTLKEFRGISRLA